MTLQDVAARVSCGQVSAAFLSQNSVSFVRSYPFAQASVRVGFDCTQAIITSRHEQQGSTGQILFVNFTRSKRCPRASNCLPCSLLLQVLQHAAAHKKKSSLWSTQSRSVSSPFIPASISNTTLRRAALPVSLRPRTASAAFRNRGALASSRPFSRVKRLHAGASPATHRTIINPEACIC